MKTLSEVEFVDQYDHPVARAVARDLHRAMNPVGMHTNGPCYVRVEASHLMRVLHPFKKVTGEDIK